jgi:hypothetical protein
MWCSQYEDVNDLVIYKINFFIHDVKRHIDAFTRYILGEVFYDASMNSSTPQQKISQLFTILEQRIVGPLFTNGTFGYQNNKMINNAFMNVWDYLSEEFMILEHSLQNLIQPDAIYEAEFISEFKSEQLKSSLRNVLNGNNYEETDNVIPF